jgi:hypothetical protein
MSPLPGRCLVVFLLVVSSSIASFPQTIDPNLVTIPVIAANIGGTYVADLTREEFTITEDGEKQNVAFFATISAPFHVVLLLDTSASTHEKLDLIQQAARSFVQQLQPADRVKIISFDQQVRDHNEFTNNRQLLISAINKTKSAEGTKLYDAMDMALAAVRKITGRKAIVVFTDGVDWHSDYATLDTTLRGLDEEGVIVYPIRYDTRGQTEQLAREQSDQPELPTLDVVRRRSGSTTEPTFPEGDPSPTPSGTPSKTGPLGLPSADEILRRRREQERDREIGRNPGRLPEPTDSPTPRTPEKMPRDPRPKEVPVSVPDRPAKRDSIDKMLDASYATADRYLNSLAEKSGGKLLRADTLASLPDAFARIAAELRTQYLIGYYPTKKETAEKYRTIKVTTTRKNVVIRARPGYLATGTFSSN